MGHETPLEWLALVEHELLLFASVFFLVGAIDELAIDAAWIWLKLTGRAKEGRICRAEVAGQELSGPAAVLIPAWHEAQVIRFTIVHARRAWPQAEVTFYIGCYVNDPETLEAVERAAEGDPRVRAVVHARHGPTTKADCLNRLYAEIEADEQRMGRPVRMVVLHDAEDMVDPAALAVLDRALDEADFVQLPVLPEAQRHSRWVGSHYIEEFAEAHGRGMVVREALSAALPAAGVGCAFARPMLARLAGEKASGPFAADSLTEDYEIGFRVKAAGGRSRFLRVRGDDDRLVATRACFPRKFGLSVRQKARWLNGIALQGWDRIGWDGAAGEWWMRARDRRGPMTALVLLVGYLLFFGGLTLLAADQLGLVQPRREEPWLGILLSLNVLVFSWRIVMRFAFTAREYGRAEGLRAIMRFPVANFIEIAAAFRALSAYLANLGGAALRWDKTDHDAHPVELASRPAG